MKFFLLFLIFKNYSSPSLEELDENIKQFLIRIKTLEKNEATTKTKFQNNENNITELRSDLREANKKSPWNKALIICSCALVVFLLFFIIKLYFQLF